MATLGAVRAIVSVNDLAKELSQNNTQHKCISEIEDNQASQKCDAHNKFVTSEAQTALDLHDTISSIGSEQSSYKQSSYKNSSYKNSHQSVNGVLQEKGLTEQLDNAQEDFALESSSLITKDDLEESQHIPHDFKKRLQLRMQEFKVLFENYQEQTLKLARSFATITSSKHDIDLTTMGNIAIHQQDIEGYESGLAYLTETLNSMESELESLLRKVEYQELSPQDVELAHLNMLEHLANTSEDRCNSADVQDDVTKGKHLDRVGELCAKIAQMLDCDDDFVNKIACSARLHDIGKIAIPDTILQKPDRLDADEYATMKMHTIHGAEMLSNNNSEIIQMAYRIALSHHENWDGTGYPHQLKQEEIVLEGRIAAVADVYDALVSSRIYKEAWPKEKAIEQIKSRRGTKFDPVVVDAFLKVIAN